MTNKEHAKKILGSGGPRHVNAITAEAIAAGLKPDKSAKTPEATMGTQLRSDPAVFIKCGKGMYTNAKRSGDVK